MTPIAGRWFKFNRVGAIGFGVQFATLALLVSGLGVHYLAATGLAVETAILHNFFWHQGYTWKGQGSGGARAVALRLLRFHLGNGMVSLLGNLVLMQLLVGALHIQYLAANVLTVAACGLLNFALGEWFVFR